MEPTDGCCIITRIYGVLQEQLTKLLRVCGPVVAHGFADIFGSVIYTPEMWNSLRSVYPILKESGRFFDEIMVKDPVHNWLVVCPSNSPENVHSGSNGKATTAAGCTMDNQLIFDLWTAIISASQILDTDQEFASHLTQHLKEMAPMQVGHWGQLQEWMFDWDDPKDVHRHISHLYGLFPSNQISLTVLLNYLMQHVLL